MIKKIKKSLTPKQLATVIASITLVVLIIAYASVTAIIGAIESGKDNTSGSKPNIIESIGESSYAGYAVAYPHFSEKKVQNLDVTYPDSDGVKQNFGVMRYDLDASKADSTKDFIFYYTDTDNNTEVYLPPIVTAEDGFDYTSLYSSDGSLGYNVYKLSFMMAAIGALYFDERMAMPTDSAERQRQLNRYGLGADERKTVVVSYLDEDDKTVTHTVHIGDMAIDGSGYYFIVEGRDYIYSSLSTNFSYLLNGFVSLISSRLVAQGLIEDKSWEPYFTTDLKQWKNTLHTEDGEIIPTNSPSVVIVTGNSIYPLYDADLKDDVADGGNGYSISNKKQLTLRIDDLAPRTLCSVLRGAAIKNSLWTSVTVTDVTNTNFVTDGATYTYVIRAIDAHFTDAQDITDPTVPVGDSRYVKVTYDYSVEQDGKTETYTSAHAVIDMQKVNTGIPQSAILAIKGMTVGTLAEPIEYSVVYDDTNSDTTSYKIVINDIVEITEKDKDGKDVKVEKVGQSSTVTYTYTLMLGDTVLETSSDRLETGKVDGTNEMYTAIKGVLLGRKVGVNLKLDAYQRSTRLQNLMKYTSYVIDSVDYFVTEEMITSLEFINASNRDPFYGESLYLNTLTGAYSIYALDSTASEAIIRLLGGINQDSSSTTSAGLVGSETVAIGLTPANMLKYGLYANTVYFELPRGIKTLLSSKGNAVDDYIPLDTLGFTLYISDEQPDGSRYIGSDMYDIVAKVSDERWMFLDMSFVDYWARKTLVAVSYSDIEKIDLKFNMDDIYGSYSFELEHNEKYIVNGKLYDQMPEGGGQVYDQIEVFVSTGSYASDSRVKELLELTGGSHVSLGAVYGNQWAVYDSLGAENFKTMLSVVFNSHYTGTFSDLTKAEKDALKAGGKLVMSFAFDIKGKAYSYVYDFYRIDDRRVMVSLYKMSPSGERTTEVYDFYVSTFTFKKIARSLISLLNGQVIDENEGYPGK